MSDPLAEHGIYPHLKSYVCIEVVNGERPVLLVARDEEGDWMFLCGESHPPSADFYRVVGIGHHFADDPTLVEVINLGVGEEAERSTVGGPWTRAAYGED